MSDESSATKRCCTCHRQRPLTEFNKRTRASDGLQSRCRDCARAWYLANGEAHRRNVRRRNDQVRRDVRLLLAAYLEEHPCVDCGESDLRVLDLDHEDPAGKTAAIGKMIVDALSWQRIEEEIAKCSVRCANCHRRRTSAMAGDWRSLHVRGAQEQLHATALARLHAVVHPA